MFLFYWEWKTEIYSHIIQNHISLQGSPKYLWNYVNSIPREVSTYIFDKDLLQFQVHVNYTQIQFPLSQKDCY